jgi:hypothetical protein
VEVEKLPWKGVMADVAGFATTEKRCKACWSSERNVGSDRTSSSSLAYVKDDAKNAPR